MPNYTTNSNLEKPLQTEFYNVDVPNANMDIIDGALKEHTDDITALESGKRDKTVQIVAADIATNAVETAKIKDGAVSTPKIADLGVTNGKLANSSVDSVKLANGAVSTEKIVDLNVTTAKVANKAIVTGKIADGGVETLNVKDGAITNAKLADGTIDTVKYKDGSIVNAKLADGTIETTKIKDGAVSGAKMANTTIDGSKLVNDFYNQIMSLVGLANSSPVNSGIRKIKLDVSTSTATSLTAWNNLSAGVKYAQGYMLSDKSLSVQWYGAWGGIVRSALMNIYIKSSGAGDVTFYMANIDNTSYVYDDDTLITTKSDKGLITIPAFTGVKNIKILTNNTGEDISCNFGGLVNAEVVNYWEVENIQLNLNSKILAVGVTQQLTTTITPTGFPTTVNWSSLSNAIATVNSSGLVTGVSAGSTLIQAYVGDVIATCIVTVR